DPVGLAGQRCQPLDLLRVGDLDLPAVKLEPVVHEPGAVHRLDRRPNRLTVTSESLAQATQPIRIRRRGTNLDAHPLQVKQVEVAPLTPELQTDVHHAAAPPLATSQADTPEPLT